MLERRIVGLALATAVVGLPRPAHAAQPSLPGSGIRAPATPPQWMLETDAWERRRRGLVAGVGVSAGVLGVGGTLLTTGLILSHGAQEPEIGLMFPGIGLIVAGAFTTALTAAPLAHHLRWDHPRLHPTRPTEGQAQRAAAHARRLELALWSLGGVALAGGLLVGAGWLSVLGCDRSDYDCQDRRVLITGAIGYPLIGGAAFAMIPTGFLLGQQRVHRHTRPGGYATAGFGPGGLRIRF